MKYFFFLFLFKNSERRTNKIKINSLLHARVLSVNFRLDQFISSKSVFYHEKSIKYVFINKRKKKKS